MLLTGSAIDSVGVSHVSRDGFNDVTTGDNTSIFLEKSALKGGKRGGKREVKGRTVVIKRGNPPFTGQGV